MLSCQSTDILRKSQTTPHMNDGTDSAQRKKELVLEGFVSFALYLYTLTKEKRARVFIFFSLCVCV
jgi:hypothetical protein